MSDDQLKSVSQKPKLGRIWAQCIKELVQFRRDRLTLALALLLPLLTLFIFGFAIRLEAKDLPIAIQDLDNSPLSRTYIERIFATNLFIPRGWSRNHSAEYILDHNIAKAAITIPPTFSRDIRADKISRVQVLVDGTDANNARYIENNIRATTNFFLATSNLQRIPTIVDAQIRLWFNPGRKESLYIVPGVYAVVLWIYPSLLAAIAMVREKEKGTIVQVYASSLTAIELLLGKGLAYFIIACAEALFIISLGCLLFRLWFAGDPTPFLIGTPIYLMTSVIFGLLIGTRATTQNAAVQAVATIGFLTSLLLTGFIYPLSNIPFPLSLISNILPARYYITLSRDAFVRGTGWISVWHIIPIISMLGFLMFNTARRLLSRMQLPQ